MIKLWHFKQGGHRSAKSAKLVFGQRNQLKVSENSEKHPSLQSIWLEEDAGCHEKATIAILFFTDTQKYGPRKSAKMVWGCLGRSSKSQRKKFRAFGGHPVQRGGLRGYNGRPIFFLLLVDNCSIQSINDQVMAFQTGWPPVSEISEIGFRSAKSVKSQRRQRKTSLPTVYLTWRRRRMSWKSYYSHSFLHGYAEIWSSKNQRKWFEVASAGPRKVSEKNFGLSVATLFKEVAWGAIMEDLFFFLLLVSSS